MSLLIVLVLLFVGQVPPGPPPPEEPYTKIALTEPDVKAAAKVALSLTKPKGKLLWAERHAISANNIRLCITMNQNASHEFARVELSRADIKKHWEVIVWSWGSCGR